MLAQDTIKIPEFSNQNTQKNRPDLGHEPRKISFFTRTENTHSLYGIEFKQGYHDLMSNDLGYDPFSQFDFFVGNLVYDQFYKNLTVDQMTIVNLISLHEYRFFDPQFSWAAKIVEDRIYDLDCKLCHRLNVRAFLGPTIKPTSNMAFTLMTGPFAEVTKNYQKGGRLGIGLEAIFLFQLSDNFKLGLWDEFRADAIHSFRRDYYNSASIKLSYFPNINNEWRLESTKVSKFRSLKDKTWLNQLNYGIYF
jgi:hypothetical protein